MTPVHQRSHRREGKGQELPRSWLFGTQVSFAPHVARRGEGVVEDAILVDRQSFVGVASGDQLGSAVAAKIHSVRLR